METIRFLHVTTHYPPDYLGGDARFVQYLSEELARMGHEVHILHNPSVYRILRKGGVSAAKEPNETSVHRHAHLAKNPRLEALISLNFGHSRAAVRTFEALIKEVQPEVIHWHNTKGFFTTPLHTPKSISLYTAHDFYAVCPRSSLLKPGYQVCERPRMCQMCLLRWKKPVQINRVANGRVLRIPHDTRVIAPSNFTARRLMEEGIRVDSVLRNFSPDLGFTGKPRKVSDIILYIGLMERHKGPLTLLEAFRKSSVQHGFSLYMLGEGSLKNRIAEMAHDYGLSHRVRMLGFVPIRDATDILDRTAAVVVPSESYENAPLVIPEAFSAGIPVIGSDIGGLPEILNPEAGSVTFPAGNIDRLATVLTNLWRERHWLDDFSMKARRTYDREFTPRVHLHRYLGFISRLWST